MSEAEYKLDMDREHRLGFGEAIFCENKTTQQIAAILEHASGVSQALLLTRLNEAKLGNLNPSLTSQIDYDSDSQTGFFRFKPEAPDSNADVGIVTAGTSDAHAAHEARRTLEFHGIEAACYFDVGVAGLWRLLDRLEDLRRHRVIIAVAGMDAALPSVLGGLVPQPIIAVPTSTGYGVARDGETALAACLASCAPGILVCNIDNGYGAACAATRILQPAKNLTRE